MLAVQHERAPRSILHAKKLEAKRKCNSRKGSKAAKLVKHETSSGSESPYSSAVSENQWNGFESSTDTVFTDFDSGFKKNGDNGFFFDYNHPNAYLKISQNSANSKEILVNRLAGQSLQSANGHHSSTVVQFKNGVNGESSSLYDYQKNHYQLNVNQLAVPHDDTNANRHFRKGGTSEKEAENDNNNMTKNRADRKYATDVKEHRTFQEPVSCTSVNRCLYDSSIQLLYMSVTWARNVQLFADLPFCDQAILLEESWTELFILNVVHHRLPVDNTILLSSNELPSQAVPPTRELLTDMRTMQNVVARFHQLQMDDVEYACLKALVLFKSGKLSFFFIENQQQGFYYIVSRVDESLL